MRARAAACLLALVQVCGRREHEFEAMGRLRTFRGAKKVAATTARKAVAAAHPPKKQRPLPAAPRAWERPAAESMHRVVW